MKQIAIFTEHTSTYAFQVMLPRMFGNGAPIKHVTSADLADKSRIERFSLIVLPGVDTEESPYHDLLNGEEGHNLLSHVADNGAVLWASCAPVYDLMDRYTYTDSKGHTTERSGLGIIKGTAKGPMWDGKALDPTGLDFNATICVDTHFTGPDNDTPVRAKLPYSNGPALQNIDTKNQVSVLARYGFTYDEGDAAMVSLMHGRGFILASGILPEVSIEQTRSFQEETGERLPRAQVFHDMLLPYESRRKMLTTRMAKLMHHHMKPMPS